MNELPKDSNGPTEPTAHIQKPRLTRKYTLALLIVLAAVVTATLLIVRQTAEAPSGDGQQRQGSSAQTPAGFTLFEDKTAGFRLALPNAWGDIYPDHLAAQDSSGQPVGMLLYRWRFRSDPNVYLFAPMREGRIAVPGYSSIGYSYNFEKRGDSYCLYFTGSSQPTCTAAHSATAPFSQDDTRGSVRTLIRQYTSSRSNSINRAFFGENPLIGQPGASTQLQEVELLGVLDTSAIYPSVTIEIIGNEDADMSAYLDQAKTIAPTIQQLPK